MHPLFNYLFIGWSNRVWVFLLCYPSIALCTSKGDISASALEVYYVSQFTVETYCFTDGRCLFKQSRSVTYHCHQYDEEISKKCRSVCPFVTLTKEAYFSFINNSRITIRISGERAWHPLHENEAILKKIVFNNYRPICRKILCLKKILIPPSLITVEE